MIRRGIHSIAACLFVIFFGVSGLHALAQSGQESSGPDFKEVYNLIREHLAGVSESDLNHEAVQGLISALSPKVSLLPKEPTGSSATQSSLVTRTNLFDGQIAYVRVGQVADGVANSVRQACLQTPGS